MSFVSGHWKIEIHSVEGIVGTRYPVDKMNLVLPLFIARPISANTHSVELKAAVTSRLVHSIMAISSA